MVFQGLFLEFLPTPAILVWPKRGCFWVENLGCEDYAVKHISEQACGVIFLDLWFEGFLFGEWNGEKTTSKPIVDTTGSRHVPPQETNRLHCLTLDPMAFAPIRQTEIESLPALEISPLSFRRSHWSSGERPSSPHEMSAVVRTLLEELYIGNAICGQVGENM